MSYIKGKFRNTIFETDAGYKVGLFRVLETDDEAIEPNKTITYTGIFADINKDDRFILHGKYVLHERYGWQYNVTSYEKLKPEGQDAIIDFLTSSFVKGCGEVLAKRIYETFGDESLEKIKEDPNNLFLVPKMTEKSATSIYASVIEYFAADKEILELKNMGFTIKETMNLMNDYGQKIMDIIESNIYTLVGKIDFKKLDNIFLEHHAIEDPRRVRACIIETMKDLTFNNGDIYLYKDEILEHLKTNYGIESEIDNHLLILQNSKQILLQEDKIYLINDYLDELNNATIIGTLMAKPSRKVPGFNSLIKRIEKDLDIKYNGGQLMAIKKSFENNISIITGGPGTGKTTVIKGLVEFYALTNKLSERGLNMHLCLLAPTGRAAKRMSEISGLQAMTIHRFLKWDKETNTFGVNELNRQNYKIYIIDEASMLDNHLLSSFFKGINPDTKLIFIGDEYQLPSVGPGSILTDMIKSGVAHISLNNIFRQSENSYIPVLAQNIKEQNITDENFIKRDDYNFIKSPASEIRKYIIDILNKTKEKDVDITKIQVLAPMYKGENGIDNLNAILQDVFNPASDKKAEVKIGPIIYRVNDKVLNLTNDTDNNIYNGDIGYIEEINLDSKTEFMIINYYGNKVSYKREDLINITHAYAMSIHKAQGSEFDHVIMPITPSYSRMLYNKLLYTGVSRAKESLVIIGSEPAFNTAISNNYSQIRKTTLESKIENTIKKEL